MTIKIGDYVSFKSDIEQTGKVKKIIGGRCGARYVLTSEYGFHGDYIGGDTETTVDACDCWIED